MFLLHQFPLHESVDQTAHAQFASVTLSITAGSSALLAIGHSLLLVHIEMLLVTPPTTFGSKPVMVHNRALYQHPYLVYCSDEVFE